MKRKWNWVDTTIVIVVVLLIGLFINRHKILNLGKKNVVSNQKEILFIVEADSITEDMLTELEVGDQIFSQNALQEAFIKDIKVESLDRPVYKSEPKLRVMKM